MIRDVIAVTESIVARAQGNYATIEDIANDVKAKCNSDVIGVTFPILSRNRFATCLKGFAMAAKKIVILFAYPSDEVGNHLMSLDDLEASGINPWTDCLTEERYRELFGDSVHPFTGVDYVTYYRESLKIVVLNARLFSATTLRILPLTDVVITCDTHTRERSKRHLKKGGGRIVLGMDDILNTESNEHGYNLDFGLLGSNKSSETSVKLFPRNCQPVVEQIQALVKEKTGKHIEAMIYGDGAFKDPVGKIWELADPVVSPAYTAGLDGTPNELKLKYLADNDFADLSSEEQAKAIEEYIRHKDTDLKGKWPPRTTPLIDRLLGSLSDLTSGSGDKGTPFVFIQGYFDNYAD